MSQHVYIAAGAPTSTVVGERVGGMVRECEVVGLACECCAVRMGEEG